MPNMIAEMSIASVVNWESYTSDADFDEGCLEKQLVPED